MSTAANLSSQEAGRQVATVEEYGDEVMCAGWNPELALLGEWPSAAADRHAEIFGELVHMDVDGFLQKMYTYQC